MEGITQFWSQSDAIGRAVAGLLLAMSISGWVVILWKVWVLRRAQRDIVRGVAAFWSSESVDAGRKRLDTLDREQIQKMGRAFMNAREAVGNTIDIAVHGHNELDTPSAIAVAKVVEQMDPVRFKMLLTMIRS